MSRTLFRINTYYRPFAVLALAGATVWSFWLRPQVIAGKQVRNWAIVQTYVSLVEQYRAAHGAYPVTLAAAIPTYVSDRDRWLAARDNYGRPLHYVSDGVQFLIASYGQDGLPDKAPAGLDDPEIDPPDVACTDASADTKYSSKGRSQRCGK